MPAKGLPAQSLHELKHTSGEFAVLLERCRANKGQQIRLVGQIHDMMTTRIKFMILVCAESMQASPWTGQLGALPSKWSLLASSGAFISRLHQRLEHCQ